MLSKIAISSSVSHAAPGANAVVVVPSLTFHPLALCGPAEQYRFHRLHVKQQALARPQARDAACLRFGLEPRHRHPEASGDGAHG
jgi:hypothetical protein